MFLLQRPTTGELDRFLKRSSELPLSYDPVGITASVPDGYRVDQAKVVMGRGEKVFASAKAALLEWKHFDLGWLEVFPPRPSIEPGTVVAVLIYHLGFWSVNGCRVVFSVSNNSGERQFGFAYGTLTNHAERGEEVFRVEPQRAR